MYLFDKQSSSKQSVVLTTVYLTITMTGWLYITFDTTYQKQLGCSTMWFLCKLIYMSGQVIPLKFHLNRWYRDFCLRPTPGSLDQSISCCGLQPNKGRSVTSPIRERCWLQCQRARGGRLTDNLTSPTVAETDKSSSSSFVWFHSMP